MYFRLLAPMLLMTGCACAPSALPADTARNTKTPTELVQAHLRAVEAGDWATAEAQLDPGFTMQMKGTCSGRSPKGTARLRSRSSSESSRPTA